MVRCLTLANALRERGIDVSFVSREHEGHLFELIDGQGFALSRLPAPLGISQDESVSPYANWLGTSWQEDAAQTQRAIEALGVRPDCLVVDHYALDYRWENVLRASVGRIMAIDDLADRVHDCDLLLDQNIVPHIYTRYTDKVPATCGLLLGPEYSLLQPIYSELHGRIPPREGAILRIFIFFGGADHRNLTGHTLAAFLSLNRPDVEVDIVVSVGSPHMESLRRQAAGHNNIHLHSGLPTLAPLMAKADLAIGASGATSWERLCLGLPTLVVTLTENQCAIADGLSQHGLIRWLGHQDAVDELVIARALAPLLQQNLDEDWSLRCLATVDGLGARRVCSALTATAATPLRVRRARLKDEAIQKAFYSDVDAAEIRRLWFRGCLRNLDGCHLYMIETTDGVVAGQVRFEREDQVWNIYYTLVSVFFGRGIDRPLLQAALLKFREEATGALEFGRVQCDHFRNIEVLKDEAWSDAGGKQLSVSVCSDEWGWINASIPELLLDWLQEGYKVAWGHNAAALPVGGICFYLSYSLIVDAGILARHQNNLVVHASDLPKGRGWSPLTWQILEGKSRILVTLFEAVEAVDSGPIYKQVEMQFSGSELIGELRDAVFSATRTLCRSFVRDYPSVVGTGMAQKGEPTFYARRRPQDSYFNIDRTLREQFNLLRTVDPEKYPAWFEFENTRFVLKIEKRAV